jgi:hypothetical protein
VPGCGRKLSTVNAGVVPEYVAAEPGNVWPG